MFNREDVALELDALDLVQSLGRQSALAAAGQLTTGTLSIISRIAPRS
jgi:hypothetical protein